MSLGLAPAVPKDAYNYGERASGEIHGVVLTKPHVVELILDLCGYDEGVNLAERTLLEPSCGTGAFLLVVVRRLVASARRFGVAIDALSPCVRAFDIDLGHVAETKKSLIGELKQLGVKSTAAETLVDAWVHEGDFLLATIAAPFDYVVGNPPYIRIEQISPLLHAEYRQRYSSLFDRADLYVAFIERGLSLLKPSGMLSFICADRWTVNRYGAPLRKLIAKDFAVRAYVDLHTASPFESEVIAYPSIFAMTRAARQEVPVVTLATASEAECKATLAAIAHGVSAEGVSVARYVHWFDGDDPWVRSSPEQLAILRHLEANFRPIEDYARVGIGVASGCDRVYVVGPEVDVEADRLVPLVMREDIEHGKVRDSQRFILNTFGTGTRVVNLDEYPRLTRYFETFEGDIRSRHVAKKNPSAWFRTIDRVYPELVGQPKLLIPDIAGSNEVAYDEGKYHPHHNLYFVVSTHWDLEVLGGLMSSRVALFFVWAYAVKMRGGYLRFQAQYLRRIRLPDPRTMSRGLSTKIRNAFRSRDFAALDTLAMEAYALPHLPDFDFVDTRR